MYLVFLYFKKINWIINSVYIVSYSLMDAIKSSCQFQVVHLSFLLLFEFNFIISKCEHFQFLYFFLFYIKLIVHLAKCSKVLYFRCEFYVKRNMCLFSCFCFWHQNINPGLSYTCMQSIPEHTCGHIQATNIHVGTHEVHALRPLQKYRYIYLNTYECIHLNPSAHAPPYKRAHAWISIQRMTNQERDSIPLVAQFMFIL